MREAFSIPTEALKEGKNVLEIIAASDKVDDIAIADVWIDEQTIPQIFNQCRLQLKAVDSDGTALPCRFTILDKNQTLAVIGTSSHEHVAIRSGVVYSSNGTAEIGLQPGEYTVICGRGFEYSISEQSVALDSEQSRRLQFQLNREVNTTGLVACDPHVHTFEVSRHGDASLDERMVTLAGEGVELAIATDHNVFVDYTPIMKRTDTAKYFTAVMAMK